MNEPSERQSPIVGQLAAPPPGNSPHEGESAGGQGQMAALANSKILQSRTMVLATLFLVTGALGIPLLWVNRRFSMLERIVWTVVVTIYTFALIGFVGWIMVWAYRQVTGG